MRPFFQWLSFSFYNTIECLNDNFFFSDKDGSTEIVIKEKAISDRKIVTIFWKNTLTFSYQEKLIEITDFYFYVLVNWDENKADELP